MSRPVRFSSLLVPALALGCGPDIAPPASAPCPDFGMHGGPLVPLPGGSGFGEVVVEGLPARGGESRSRLAVYFIRPDLRTPTSPLPSAASIWVVSPSGGGTMLTLSREPKSGGDDPSGPARFVSEPGTFDYDELRGELTATVAGQAVTKPFSFR